MKPRGTSWACEVCGGDNRASTKICTGCGSERSAPSASQRAFCPYDGAPLLASGICQTTGGYPLGTPCPFACPICRKTLEWHGGCYTCFGRARESDPKTFPGDRYELVDDAGKPIGDGQHWILVESGPRPAATPAQNKAAHLIRNRISTGDLSVSEAHEQLARIFR